MRRARNRLIKRAMWEVRYNTRLVFFDRQGTLLQPLLDWDEGRFFPRWLYGVNGVVRLTNPETFTEFSVGPKSASAGTENLDPTGDLGRFEARVIEFLERVGSVLEVPQFNRVGKRLQYIIETRETSETFAEALSRQLTGLASFSDTVDACRGEDISLIWVSATDLGKFRWTVGPLALREFPGWFASSTPREGAPTEIRRFFPQVSLLVDVDASKQTGMQTSDLRSFLELSFQYVDSQVLALASRIQET